MLTFLWSPSRLHFKNSRGCICLLNCYLSRNCNSITQINSMDRRSSCTNGCLYFCNSSVSKWLSKRKTIHEIKFRSWWKKTSHCYKRKIAQIDSSRFCINWWYCSNFRRYGNPSWRYFTWSQRNNYWWKCHDRINRSCSQKDFVILYQKERITWKKWRKKCHR